MKSLHRGSGDSHTHADVGPMLLYSDDIAFTFPHQEPSGRFKLYREADWVIGSIGAMRPEERTR